jgi:hypothetical protein
LKKSNGSRRALRGCEVRPKGSPSLKFEKCLLHESSRSAGDVGDFSSPHISAAGRADGSKYPYDGLMMGVVNWHWRASESRDHKEESLFVKYDPHRGEFSLT